MAGWVVGWLALAGCGILAQLRPTSQPTSPPTSWFPMAVHQCKQRPPPIPMMQQHDVGIHGGMRPLQRIL